jgi:GTP-binding protein
MIDLVKISVKAGGGGNGCISFRREKFVPKGGPDGGDGGLGGNIYVAGDPSLNTLLHLQYHSTWVARRGGHGKGQKKRGANGENVIIPVPIGTVVWKLSSGGDREFMVDVADTEPVLVARGGAGGAGNTRFASAIRQEPVLAEKGGPGEGATLILELKLLADVGLIGQPNAGKSTLLSSCSAAKPKIASYPFTTTDPVLGVVDTRDKSFIMMEIPGLIEGAHKGAGLGHEFLRHTERARLLIHILDGLSDDPLEDWRRINQELASFDPSLGKKPQIIAVNKVDIPEVAERIPSLKDALGSQGMHLFFVSAATREGIDPLLGKTLEILDGLPREDPTAGPRELPLIAPKAKEEPFRVAMERGVYVIYAPKVERLVPLADLKDWRAMVQIWKELQRIGAVKVLEERGVQPGDTVRLGGVDLEWY